MGRCDQAVEFRVRHWHSCGLWLATDPVWSGRVVGGGPRSTARQSVRKARDLRQLHLHLFVSYQDLAASVTRANFSISFGGSFFLLLYYLPIYFQSVDGVSASQSGINNIPLVLGVCK